MTFSIRDMLWLFFVVAVLLVGGIAFDRQRRKHARLESQIKSIEIRNRALEQLWSDAKEIEHAIRERPNTDSLEPKIDYLRHNPSPNAREIEGAIDRYKQKYGAQLPE